MALLVAHLGEPGLLFPELATVKDDEEEETFPDEETSVKYVFADDAVYDPKQIEEEMRAMAAAAAVSGTSSFGGATNYSDWV